MKIKFIAFVSALVYSSAYAISDRVGLEINPNYSEKTFLIKQDDSFLDEFSEGRLQRRKIMPLQEQDIQIDKRTIRKLERILEQEQEEMKFWSEDVLTDVSDEDISFLKYFTDSFEVKDDELKDKLDF